MSSQGGINTDLPHGPCHSGAIRSSNGCWTCRLRRKKCDEMKPVCGICRALLITCYNSLDKPAWMDGGRRQEEMAARLKREVKEKSHLRLRRWGGEVQNPDESVSLESRNVGLESSQKPSTALLQQRGSDCTLKGTDGRGSIDFRRADTVLVMFYLDHLLPFLFPFYCPSPLEGGTSWILEMMVSSPVVRQATLCQSSYFFSLARGTTSYAVMWDTMLAQTSDAFRVLRQSLQVINNSNILEHLHGAVRILASIMQLQRFEVAISNLTNCRAHLNAALALFVQLLNSNPGGVEPADPGSTFNAVMERLGPPTRLLPADCAQVPSAEQAAFRFSSALLIFHDLIVSTMLQQEPGLYEYHRSLLGSTDGADPLINLEAVVGCQTWVLVHIGETAKLDAWKQQCKRAGTLNVMELVHRATSVKDSLDAHLARLETQPETAPNADSSNLLNVFRADYGPESKTPASQTALVSRVWAHAALLYLYVVVSGYQPSSGEVRHHVCQILELLTHQISPPALLRTMAWPFCVAGCLAEAAQEAQFRGMVAALRPAGVFGTLSQALETMEKAWGNRGALDSMSDYIAKYFRTRGELLLLV